MTTQYYTASSIDGFIADPDNSLSWLFQFSDPSGMEDEFPAVHCQGRRDRYGLHDVRVDRPAHRLSAPSRASGVGFLMFSLAEKGKRTQDALSYNALTTSRSDVIDASRATASQFAPTQLDYEEA